MDLNYDYNSAVQGINVDNALSAILSEFDTMSIIQIVKDSIEKYRFRPYINSQAPNIVYAYEQNFQLLIQNFPAESNKIIDVRNNTYIEIISVICQYFHLEYNREAVNSDCYNVAFTLYDIFVANFTRYMIDFYTNYINIERNSLSSYLQLGDPKKNKDTMLAYAKMLFTDSNLISIYVNMDAVINTIASMDISLDQYLSFVTTVHIKNIVTQSVTEIQNYFKSFIAPYAYDSSYRSDILSLVRLSLQRNLKDKEE